MRFIFKEKYVTDCLLRTIEAKNAGHVYFYTSFTSPFAKQYSSSYMFGWLVGCENKADYLLDGPGLYVSA